MLSKARGFSLFETSMVLLVSGAIALAMFTSPQRSTSPAGATKNTLTRQVAPDYTEQIVDAILRYAKNSHSLPCIDANGNGRPGLGGACALESHQIGAVPFITLGLDHLMERTDGVGQRYFYGLLKGEQVQKADLATAFFNQDIVSSKQPDNYRDVFLQSIRQLQQLGFRSDRIHVTGDGGQHGAADCGVNKSSNLAFFVVYAGDIDADGDGSLLDGENSKLNWPLASNVYCVAHPDTPRDQDYDDRVITVSLSELAGFVAQ